ncbi:MAG: transcription termination/antitermination protein NusG [Propionibacteriaceae bacterium]|nr:transcription termination/antitermination protein NusG [Propionibacteriaceae bacterium]
MTENTTSADDFEIDLGVPETPEPSTDDVEIDLGALTDDEPEDVPELAELAEEPEEEDEGDDATDVAIEALRQELESKYGEWYVIHTYSGMENRVKQNVDARSQSLDMEDYIFETIVPTEDVVELRNNTRKTVTRCVLPGYVLVRMELTDESWGVVRHTPSVTGFVGHGQTPVPLSVDEVLHMLTPSVIARVAAETSGTSARQRGKKVEVIDFEIGDSIMVADGPFAGMHATITEINPKNARLKALVDFMGRETPLDLEFKQVEKVV